MAGCATGFATAGGVGFGGAWVCGGAADCGGAAVCADAPMTASETRAAAASVKRCKLNTEASWRRCGRNYTRRVADGVRVDIR
jgi:hypothetical protein